MSVHLWSIGKQLNAGFEVFKYKFPVYKFMLLLFWNSLFSVDTGLIELKNYIKADYGTKT